MKKTIKFQTVSLGSDLTGKPGMDELKEWIRDRHHRGGDLLLFHLLRETGAQRAAGLDALCAGGPFYGDRIMNCLKGVRNSTITGELDIDESPVISDMHELITEGYRFRLAVPAPHEYRLADQYYGEPEEALMALISLHRRLFREIRDAGIPGHVVIYQEPVIEEFESMAGKKIFFFNPSHTRPDLELLLEYQDTVAVSPAGLDLVIDMTGEYTVKGLVLLDPTAETITHALRHWDPGNIAIGGYFHGQPDGYWDTIVSASAYTVSLSE